MRRERPGLVSTLLSGAQTSAGATSSIGLVKTDHWAPPQPLEFSGSEWPPILVVLTSSQVGLIPLVQGTQLKRKAPPEGPDDTKIK